MTTNPQSPETSTPRPRVVAMRSWSVICPKCTRPGFSWGRSRCMYCGFRTPDWDPRLVHEFPAANDELYLGSLRQTGITPQETSNQEKKHA